ncbi:MAG: pyridoxal phosphate-dependent aminotransferase, partial [Deltaproteobacteria bacterium]|nr:pyridoxal phosphate-dependent aminotransferase [Deltaproteobacteria bacterium]
MSVSKRMREYLSGGSLIRRLFDDATQMRGDGSGQMVCDFTLGNPTLSPPSQFGEALARYVSNPPEGAHSYMPNAGLGETRQAIAHSLRGDHDLCFDAAHVLMTVGAAGAVNVAFKAIL